MAPQGEQTNGSGARGGWMIYGAYGYTGVLVAEEAVRRGHRPLLSGRSPEKLDALAARLGLDWIACGLDNPTGLVRELSRVDLVFHAAGPFVQTAEPMRRACLEARTSYVDITGEVPVFRDTLASDAMAKERGIAMMSGVGFDVVPTDCLAAYVASKVPGATELEIAFAGLGKVSPGTLKSVVEGAAAGGLARRGGRLVPIPLGRDVRRIRFADRERSVLAIPWGDLVTAHQTTGIPNITTYMAMPGRVAEAAQAAWWIQDATAPLLRKVLGAERVKRALSQLIETRVAGPDEAARQAGRSEVWARASADGARQSYEAWLRTGEGYAFTAVAGVRCVEKILAARGSLTGALTPAGAFGADFVLEIEGTKRYDALPAVPL